jgi:CheY-like chemotaxis protein
MSNHILVADDRASSREFLRTVLENCGYRVTEAADGREAVDKARQSDPDLILLDLHMPVLDGYGVLRELRAEERFAKIPIVAVTASAMYGDREGVLGAGFTGYISKPVSIRDLRTEVARILNTSAGT